MKMFNIGSKGSGGYGGYGITIISVFLVVVLTLMIFSFVFVANERRHDAQYLSLVGEHQLRTQRVAINSLSAGQGDIAAFAKLNAQVDKIDHIVNYYKNGDPVTGMKGTPEELLPAYNKVESTWLQVRTNIQSILNGRSAVTNVKSFVIQVNDFIPQLMSASEDVVSLLVKEKASNQIVLLASKQLMLIQRIENNLNRILSADERALTAADKFGRDVALFGRVLDGMLKGSKELKFSKIKNKEIIKKLKEVEALFIAVSENVGGILDASPDLFRVGSAVQASTDPINDLLGSIKGLDTAYKSYTTRLDVVFIIGITLGLFSLVALFLLVYVFVKNTQSRLASEKEASKRTQKAILNLLDELTNLADGDLTFHASVTEDITGAIADSVNYAIDALRSLVETINNTAKELGTETSKSEEIAIRLAEESKNQTREISSVSTSITNMAQAMTKVSEDANSSSDFALQSVDIASKGMEAVQSTIVGMNGIREQIQETSKRIKRLGESSQEIGDIIGLITEIADQTNILALNAAIQASTAGDAGRGFAVVADEVQKLAERSSNAAKQVEGLIRTIQADTNEAISSMEESTSNVVNGAKLAENAGASLDEIEGVSKELAQLITDISKSSKGQVELTKRITDSMAIIQEITIKTSEGSKESSESIRHLTTLASSLRESVSGFKLPESGLERSNG